ncbi:MAG: ergothioneine biosynthesis protein EgtB [Akkermansiaceae bacterium]|nr:ergothioneine biosynthesis protein EgtB [Akkermansiaceae bacterium]
MNTKESLVSELERTDRRMRALIDDLSEEQLAVPYDQGINPPVWELGHTAFFYEYFLLRAKDGAAARMPGYDDIWDSFEIQHKERWREDVVPGKEAAVDYYRGIIDDVHRRLESRELTPEEHYLYKYVICHQHMHLESLIWARQTLGYPAPPGAAGGADGGGAGEAAGDVAIPGGTYFMGMPAGTEDFATTGFAFDNEKPGFEAEVPPFAISTTLVSNREFREFVDAGGYRDPALWSYGGQRWLEHGHRHPVYWRQGRDGGWEARRFDRWRELRPDAPVMHVSYWEAEAFAKWAGRRLPNEREWEAAARGSRARMFPWGDAMDAGRADLDGTAAERASVAAWKAGATPEGCLQMIGTAWEWTSSQFLPYDGFCVDVYPYMSTIQFGNHKVAKGGSFATSACLIRNSYRQAYYPDRSDVFTGFRTCAV